MNIKSFFLPNFHNKRPTYFLILLSHQQSPAPPPTCSGSLQGLPQNVQQQPQSHQQESLCAEMARELCRALRCRAPSRRRRACEKCSTHVISYHPSDNPTPTSINGMRTQVSPHYLLFTFFLHFTFYITYYLNLHLNNNY